jgi:uncharacterized DUF497 family protein
MPMQFRWNRWNTGHLETHGISVAEAEFIVERARRPYPEMIGDEKRYVAGQTPSGLYAQVIYLLDADGTVFIIHARPLNDSEKRKFRRRTK